MPVLSKGVGFAVPFPPAMVPKGKEIRTQARSCSVETKDFDRRTGDEPRLRNLSKSSDYHLIFLSLSLAFSLLLLILLLLSAGGAPKPGANTSTRHSVRFCSCLFKAEATKNLHNAMPPPLPVPKRSGFWVRFPFTVLLRADGCVTTRQAFSLPYSTGPTSYTCTPNPG